MIYVQLGAGASDLDPITRRDGFAEYVKKYVEPSDKEARIVLVEANPANEGLLAASWKDYPQAEIWISGVLPREHGPQTTTFYYVEENAPSYQTFSAHRSHLESIHPGADILEKKVATLGIQEFFRKIFSGARGSIELLAIDLEGLDAEILLSIPWNNLNIHKISFEWVHLGENKNLVIRSLLAQGFRAAGEGLDQSGLDWLYVRPKSLFEWWLCIHRQANYRLKILRETIKLRTRFRAFLTEIKFLSQAHK